MYVKTLFSGITLGILAVLLRAFHPVIFNAAMLVAAALLLYFWIFSDVKPKRRQLPVSWALLLAAVVSYVYPWASALLYRGWPIYAGASVAAYNYFIITALAWTTFSLLLGVYAVEKFKLGR